MQRVNSGLTPQVGVLSLRTRNELGEPSPKRRKVSPRDEQVTPNDKVGVVPTNVAEDEDKDLVMGEDKVMCDVEGNQAPYPKWLSHLPEVITLIILQLTWSKEELEIVLDLGSLKRASAAGRKVVLGPLCGLSAWLVENVNSRFFHEFASTKCDGRVFPDKVALEKDWKAIWNDPPKLSIKEGSEDAPLADAHFFERPKKTAMMLLQGFDIDAKIFSSHWGEGTTLMHVTAEGRPQEVQFLLDLGADADGTTVRGDSRLDPSRYDFGGDSTVMIAASAGRHDTAQVLINAGADVDAKNFFGYTPLIKAAEYGHKAVAGVLLAAGANPDAQTNVGQTALMEAARRATIGTVPALLAAGANLKIGNNCGSTARWFAENGRPVTSSDAVAELVREAHAADTALRITTEFLPEMSHFDDFKPTMLDGHWSSTHNNDVYHVDVAKKTATEVSKPENRGKVLKELTIGETGYVVFNDWHLDAAQSTRDRVVWKKWDQKKDIVWSRRDSYVLFPGLASGPVAKAEEHPRQRQAKWEQLVKSFRANLRVVTLDIDGI